MKELNTIDGHFICCQLPINKDGSDVIDLRISWVRLDSIKSIHAVRNPDGKSCIFHTYKDTWYVCALGIDDLKDAINNYFKSTKGLTDEP